MYIQLVGYCYMLILTFRFLSAKYRLHVRAFIVIFYIFFVWVWLHVFDMAA